MRPGHVNANALNLRRYRKANPGYAERERKRTTARWEALHALARRYPAEYMRLYEAELAHAGIDAGPPMERPCRCGGVIRRRSPYGRWPASCEDCRAKGRKRPVPGEAGGEQRGEEAA
jgi:hypothetical protein